MKDRIPWGSYHRKLWLEGRHLKRNWLFTERCAKANPLWFTPWNKNKLKEGSKDWREGLFGGLDRLDWIEKHRDWFYVGKWNSSRQARAVWITPKGRAELKKVNSSTQHKAAL